MPDATQDIDPAQTAALRRSYLMRLEEDTLRQRPLWIRVIIVFLGTFVLVTVAAGSGVINHYVGGGPISRTAAVIAPGAAVMAMIYAWGPAVRRRRASLRACTRRGPVDCAQHR